MAEEMRVNTHKKMNELLVMEQYLLDDRNAMGTDSKYYIDNYFKGRDLMESIGLK